MIKLLPLDDRQSADLRNILQIHLMAMHISGALDRYHMIDHAWSDHDAMDIDLGNLCTMPCLSTTPYVSSAYHIWSAMLTEDRYAVLDTFRWLYAKHSNEGTKDPTIVFCMVFINDLAVPLTKAAQWPH